MARIVVGVATVATVGRLLAVSVSPWLAGAGAAAALFGSVQALAGQRQARRRVARRAEPAPADVAGIVGDVAVRFGLRSKRWSTVVADGVPVAAAGGGIGAVLVLFSPEFLAHTATSGDGRRLLGSVAAHEVAHLWRRDHLAGWAIATVERFARWFAAVAVVGAAAGAVPWLWPVVVGAGGTAAARCWQRHIEFAADAAAVRVGADPDVLAGFLAGTCVRRRWDPRRLWDTHPTGARRARRLTRGR